MYNFPLQTQHKLQSSTSCFYEESRPLGQTTWRRMISMLKDLNKDK